MVKYDSAKHRRQYMKHKGLKPTDIIECENPYCHISQPVKKFQLHHIWVRMNKKNDPDDVENMALICKKDHDYQHWGWKLLYSKKGKK